MRKLYVRLVRTESSGNMKVLCMMLEFCFGDAPSERLNLGHYYYSESIV